MIASPACGMRQRPHSMAACVHACVPYTLDNFSQYSNSRTLLENSWPSSRRLRPSKRLFKGAVFSICSWSSLRFSISLNLFIQCKVAPMQHTGRSVLRVGAVRTACSWCGHIRAVGSVRECSTKTSCAWPLLVYGKHREEVLVLRAKNSSIFINISLKQAFLNASAARSSFHQIPNAHSSWHTRG